jgi:hypothetical protein
VSRAIRQLQADLRDAEINLRPVRNQHGAVVGVERIGQLYTPLDEIRERIERLHLAGLCVLHVLRDRWLVGLPDGGDVDWFAVFRCGHISPRHVEATTALCARCATCDEIAADQRNAGDILTVLRHVESVALSRSGAARCEMHQSGQ